MPKGKKSESYEIEWATISVKTIKVIVFIVLASAVFLVYWFWLRDGNSEPAQKPPVEKKSAARFIAWEGKVDVKSKDEFVWKSASLTMDIQEGDRIRTAPDSSAKIQFEDGTEMVIQSDSTIEIKKPASSGEKEQALLVAVDYGTTDINAEKSRSGASVTTKKMPSIQIDSGSETTVIANEQTGEHSTIVRKGHAVLTDNQGGKTVIGENEQVKVAQDNTLTKTKLPFSPALFSPQDGQIFEFLTDQPLAVELKWRDVPQASVYHLQVSQGPLFGKLSGEKTNLTKTSLTIEIPKGSKKQYFWRARSVDQAKNQSLWSKPFVFSVQPKGQFPPGPTSMDKTPPVLEVTEMYPYFPFVQVGGKTEPEAVLTINGEIIDVKDDGTFVHNYLLRDSGWNELVFLAKDPSGNENEVVKRVENRY